MALAPQPQSKPGFTLDIRWLGALFALWVILTALATLETTRDLAVALAWAIALSALIFAVSPSGANALARTGLVTKG